MILNVPAAPGLKNISEGNLPPNFSLQDMVAFRRVDFDALLTITNVHMGILNVVQLPCFEYSIETGHPGPSPRPNR